MPALRPIPPNRLYLLWLGLLGLVMLYFAMLMVESLAIERSLNQRVDKVIEGSGLSRVVPDVRGRDVVLQGHVSSPEAMAEARRLVEQVLGVRKVDSRLAVKVRKLPWLRVQSDDRGRWIVSGRLPQGEMRARVGQSLVKVNAEAVNRIELDPEVAMPKWLGLIEPLFESGTELQGFSMEIGAGKVTVGGRLQGIAGVEPRLQALRELVEPYHLQVVNRLALVSH